MRNVYLPAMVTGMSYLTKACKWLAQKGLGKVAKNRILLRTAKDRK